MIFGIGSQNRGVEEGEEEEDEKGRDLRRERDNG